MTGEAAVFHRLAATAKRSCQRSVLYCGTVEMFLSVFTTAPQLGDLLCLLMRKTIGTKMLCDVRNAAVYARVYVAGGGPNQMSCIALDGLGFGLLCGARS